MNVAAAPLAPPSWLRFVLFLLGLGVCAYFQWNIAQRVEWYWSTWGFMFGALLAAVALGPPRAMRAPETRPLVGNGGGEGRGLGIVLSAVGLAIAIFGSWTLSVRWDQRFELGFSLLVLGTAIAGVGLGRLDARWRKDAEPLPWLRWEILAFVAILALGLFLRFYRFGEFPPYDGVCAVEEPQSGDLAAAIRAGERPWEFLLDRWVAVPFMEWLGDTFTAIRIPFTILSWLTIVPLYLLLRELVSRPAALSATLLFTFCRWHLAYARSAHNIFGPTLPLILVALYLSVRAYRRGGIAAYLWIGALAGYTLYTYAGYRGTTAFLALFFGISLVQHLWEARRAVIPSARAAIRRSLEGQLVGAVFVVVGFTLLAVPLYFRIASGDPAHFVEAAVRATNNPTYYHDDTKRMLEQRLERVRETAAMFNHHGDGSAVFNMPGEPQLDPISGALFVLGLAYCAVWAFRRMQGYFLVYFVLLLGFGTVFTHNFDIRRLQGVIPLVFILSAFFLDGAIGFTRRRLGRAAWIPLAVAGVGLGGVAFAENYRHYFRDMMSSPVVLTAFHTNYTISIRYYHDMPDDGYLQLISEMNNFFLPSDYAWWRGDRLPGDVSHDLWPLFAGEEGPWKGRELHVLVRLPEYEGEEIAAVVRKRFPRAECSEFIHPDGPVFATFMACRLRDHGDGRSFRGGVRARYFREGGEEPLLERNEPVISHAFHPNACLYPLVRHVRPCRAEWEGVWKVADAGKYQLRVETRNGTVRVRLNGRELVSTLPSHYGPGQVVHTSVDLEPGEHRLDIHAAYRSLDPSGTRVLIRRAGEHEWRLLEFSDLANLTDAAGESGPSDESNDA